MNAFRTSAFALASMAALACSDDVAPGPAGPPGAEGPPGKVVAPTSPGSINLVTPSKGILDRVVEVSIGGAGTAFDADSKPDFGAGIAVLEVIPSSPTLLVARIEVSKAATLGPRTVRVGTASAEAAFTVIPAIELVSADGTVKVPQGGLVQFDLTNNDTRAFDTNAFQVSGPGLKDLGSSASGPQAATALLLSAPLSATGTTQIEAANLGADGKSKVSFASGPKAFEIVPRAATPLALGAGSEQTFDAVLDTKLLKVSTSQISLLDYRIQVASGAATIPVAFLFDKAGTAESLLGQVLPPRNPFSGAFNPPPYDLHIALPVVDTQAFDHYAVLADLSGQAGTKTTITATRIPGIASAEAGGAHGQAAPQVVDAIPASDARIVTAVLGAASEVDAYQLTVDAAAGLQIAAIGDPDLEIFVTKDANVLADPQGTPAGSKKVVATLYAGKTRSAQRILAPPGTGTLYVVVRRDTDGAVTSGPYNLGIRRLP